MDSTKAPPVLKAPLQKKKKSSFLLHPKPRCCKYKKKTQHRSFTCAKPLRKASHLHRRRYTHTVTKYDFSFSTQSLESTTVFKTETWQRGISMKNAIYWVVRKKKRLIQDLPCLMNSLKKKTPSFKRRVGHSAKHLFLVFWALAS